MGEISHLGSPTNTKGSLHSCGRRCGSGWSGSSEGMGWWVSRRRCEHPVGSHVRFKRTSMMAPDTIGRIAVLSVAVAASLGLLPSLGNSMFVDDGATLYSAHLTWSDLWAQSQHEDLVLLPYYVLIHFWSMLSGNIDGWGHYRSSHSSGPSCGGGAWPAHCGQMVRHHRGRSDSQQHTSLLKALNARPYEISALLVALCAVSLLKWLDDARARWLWAFSILAILATATQLFALLAPASMLLCVLGVRPKLLAQRFRALLAPLGLLAVVSGHGLPQAPGKWAR